MYPDNSVRLEGDHAAQMVKLVQALEDHDDVQNVYANYDIDEALMEQLSA
jgi:transcriptional/translational regulatory protein YebC/TACO1